MSRTYLDFLLLPPFGGGGWGGGWGALAAPNSMLPLLLGCELTDCKFDSALQEMYPLLEYLPI